MTTCISEKLLESLSEFVAARMGLHFPKERRRDLERGIISAAKEFGFADAESCAKHLLSSPLTKSELEVLAGGLTVGETYFFRDEKSFRIIEEHVLSELLCCRRDGEKRLRIWSAGCATGEEPYSVALLLSKMVPDLKDWNVTILATDINTRFLSKAAKGVYGEWSFRDTPEWVRERYFRETKEGRFEILSRAKEMVTFAYLNLAEDTYPSLVNNTNAMDIVFCRNVLMYFNPGAQRKVIQNLYRSLVDGGWLIVSPSEISNALFPEFAATNFSGMTFYKKQGMGTRDQGPGTGKAEYPSRIFVPEAADPDLEPCLPILVPCAPAPAPRPPLPDPYTEAEAFYEQGCYDEAEGLIEILLAQTPGDSKAMALLARVYANQGRLSEALEWSEKAAASDKLNPARHYLLATILQEQGKTVEAVGALKRSLYLDPDFALAYFALGNLMRRQGRPAESQRYFRNALAPLKARGRDEILEASEGLTAGRLIEIINSSLMRSDGHEEKAVLR